MTNPAFPTPLMSLSPFDMATQYVSSLAMFGAGFSHHAALMAHREDLARQRAAAQNPTKTT